MSAIWILVARPAQLLQMLKQIANIVNGVMVFLILALGRVVPATVLERSSMCASESWLAFRCTFVPALY